MFEGRSVPSGGVRTTGVHMRLTSFDELLVVDPHGKTVGRVSRALFHPAAPALVGFEVRLTPIGHIVERQRRYVPLSNVTVTDDQLTLAEGTHLETLHDTRSGIDWERAPVWKGMPVRGGSGAALGEVKDADLEPDGTVSRLILTRGTASDAAIGTREVEGASVTGFSQGAVRLDDSLAAPEFSGGLAAGAGKTSAVAKSAAKRAASSGMDTAAKAARSAGRSSLGRRAAASWRGLAEGIKEGLADEPGKDRR